jgi:hypothetical protein
MLVCNVSLRPPRAGIAADIAEIVTAVDATATGQVVFATLVDDPASVRDRVDAYLGEIMVEAASAAATVTAGLAYAAAINETVTAADTVSAAVPVAATVAEAATAADTPSATVTAPATNNKTIDGTAGGQFSTTNTGTVTLTTTQANDVIILSYYHNANLGPRTIATVTSAHLTWARRSRNAWGSDSDNEIWWATASSPLTAEVITITLASGNIDDAAYHAFGVSGCPNPSSPWDLHASLTTAFTSAFAQSTPLTLSGISTNSSVPMLIGNTGSYNNIAITPPSGTTAVRSDQVNTGGILFARTSTFYRNYSSQISSASFSTTPASGSPNWSMVIDALA